MSPSPEKTRKSLNLKEPSFRDFNEPKKRKKPKQPKRKLPPKTTKGFKNDLL
tara:strand:+ start:70 stop:225 length:156 start_codon:yes stop_codon:yes gene_type:complete